MLGALIMTAALAPPASAHTPTSTSSDVANMITFTASAQLQDPINGWTYAPNEFVTYWSAADHFVKLKSDASGDQDFPYAYKMTLFRDSEPDIKVKELSGTKFMAAGATWAVPADLIATEMLSVGAHSVAAYAWIRDEWSTGVGAAHGHSITIE